VEQIYRADDPTSRKLRIQISYQNALSRYGTLRGLGRVSWVTWSIVLVTTALWCFTAYQVALAAGAHNIHDIFANIISNAINVQDRDNNATAIVLITYGAKDNDLIIAGQYWRFITPIFLHVNLLHIGLNMLNLAVLGVFLERIVGHLRFFLIYVVAGVVSIIASFYFAPQEISVGASGAIFGLVGAYSIFVLVHRHALPRKGTPALLWLIFIIGINLSVGLFFSTVDNYAHVGGLLSGCLLGWEFTPLYTLSPTKALIDAHSLSRRWPLALLTIVGTLILAMIAVYRMGG
jgi:membrane associated rhomboid family serine protease